MPARRRIAALVVLALGATAALGGGGDARAELPAPPPNVVVILTDDQTLESLRVMTSTQALVADRGVTFDVAIASYPLCCPARASLLTGQYAHNTGVLSNHSGRRVPGGYAAYRDGAEPEAVPVALQNAGYQTAFVGRYLNGWGTDGEVGAPPGWDVWRGGVGTSVGGYHSLQLSRDGQTEDRSGEYQTDVLTAEATAIIADHDAGAGPLFLMTAYFAPHYDTPTLEATGRYLALPATRHRGTFAGTPRPAVPSVDHRDPNKPGYTRRLAPLTRTQRHNITRQYRSELEALLAVDDGVAAIDAALAEHGLRDDTIVVFTSDNGYLHGQHRHRHKKHLPYEPAIRVPLLMAGPGIPVGRTEAVVANIDIPATILDYAGAAPLRPVDGVSLRPLIEGAPVWARDVLLTGRTGLPGKPSFDGVRTATHTYVEYDIRGRTRYELFDLLADPHQLANLVRPASGVPFDPGLQPVVDDLAARLDELVGCAGPSCQ